MPLNSNKNIAPEYSEKLITKEETRLADILQAISLYDDGRLKQLKQYQQELREIQAQRLDAQSWNEKNKLTEKLRDKQAYDPSKYLPPFHNTTSPYFASFSIADQDQRIGKKEYLLGKQSLFKDNRVVIIDWRQSAVSALYYEYEEGEEYEEEINGRERLGELTGKTRYSIKNSELLKIEQSDFNVEKRSGEWQNAATSNSTATIKEETGDHHLCDIVSLISPEQFRLITQDYHGCLRLQGSAGAGKTTIALHRLSFLLFNYPKKFRPERCLVLMFNRALRNYVSSTANEMLGKKTPVETFHSWAALSLKSLGLKKITFGAFLPQRFDQIKKAPAMANIIEEYAQNAKEATATGHLYTMFSSSDLICKHLENDIEPSLLKNFTSFYKKKLDQSQSQQPDNQIGFADAGILLRLFQIRTTLKNSEACNLALNYFDHLVIDEAQDFSQVELECLLNATTKERSLTICADPNQQILNFIDVSGLKNFQINLKKSGVNSENLQISYRSTEEIMEVANSVLELGPGESTHRGEPVIFRLCADKDDALIELKKTVLHYQENSPNGLVAIICKLKSEVQQLYLQLKEIQGVRIEPQRFQPGVLITNAHQVKGLEFTSVIAWNPSEKAFRKGNINDRNLLYVTLSRACERLAVICHETPTGYISKFFK